MRQPCRVLHFATATNVVQLPHSYGARAPQS